MCSSDLCCCVVGPVAAFSAGGGGETWGLLDVNEEQNSLRKKDVYMHGERVRLMPLTLIGYGCVLDHMVGKMGQ